MWSKRYVAMRYVCALRADVESRTRKASKEPAHLRVTDAPILAYTDDQYDICAVTAVSSRVCVNEARFKIRENGVTWKRAKQ